MYRTALLLIFFMIGTSFAAQADNQKLIVAEICTDNFAHKWGLLGSLFSCDEMSSAKEAIGLINVALVPASVAFGSPVVQKALAIELAALGLTMANPMVVSATVIGATGITVFHYLLKLEAEDCLKVDQEKLRRSIINELNENILLNKKS